MTVVPAAAPTVVIPARSAEPIPAPTPVSRQQPVDAATVVVKLPADARLTVDGKTANLTSGTRTFTTPRLDQNRDYYYTLQAEVDRGGQTVTESKRVVVRAGRTATVDFGDMSNTVVRSVTAQAAPARITVQLPTGGRLFVNDQRVSVTSFETPKLEPGHQYSYTLRAELERSGQTLRDSRTVTFESGKEVSVDFRALAPAVATASR